MNLFKVGGLIPVFLLSIICCAHAQQNSPSTQYQYFSQSIDMSNNSYDPGIGNLSLQFGSGFLLGTGGGIVGGVTTALLFENPNDESAGLSTAEYFGLGAIVPYTLGTAAGIYWVANSGQYKASFSRILIASAVGAAFGTGTFLVTKNLTDKNTPLELTASLALAVPLIGGIIGNSSSITKRSMNSSALFNITDGDTGLSTPAVQLTRVDDFSASGYKLSNSYSPTVKLLNISL